MLTSTEEAKKIVDGNKYVSIIWYSNDCPVCEYFLEQTKTITEDLPNWKIAYVCAEEYEQELFEPPIFPTTFIFKEGKRMFVGGGQVPYEEVLRLHNDIESGTFKSQIEIEEKMLKKMENI